MRCRAASRRQRKGRIKREKWLSQKSGENAGGLTMTKVGRVVETI
jgi:hypothetical protein